MGGFEVTAYAALVSLINNIKQITTHPRLSSSLDNNHIQPLLEKAEIMLDFIEGYSYGGGDNEAKDLEIRLVSAAHAAEDVIESHIVDQIHAGTNESSIGCSLNLQQIIQDLDAVIEKAWELKEKWGSREEITHSRPLMEVEGSGHGMVGRNEELHQLLDELTRDTSSTLRVISVVGMGGAGKTTLAKTAYVSLHILHHFDIRAWAIISQQYNVGEILSQLLSGKENPSGRTVDELGSKLLKTLSGRRYLIVLDDVWSVQVWDDLMRFFPENKNGSWVVLTTRLSNVGHECGSNSCLTMKPLDEEICWKLFCKKAFQHEDCPHPELKEVGKEIVRSCKGLPLSIVVIGGSLLKSPRRLGYWEDFARGLKSIPNSKEKQESLDVLFSSYNNLPPHLKLCFLYTGVNKRGYSKISVSKLIRLWIAEGFLKPNGAQDLEKTAEGYLHDLIERNLILEGKRRQDNGKLKSCDIHDLLRDLCINVCKQQENIRGPERRLARSIMASGVEEEVHDKHRLLRVLDVGVHGKPEELFKCVNLRYLAFELPVSSLKGWDVWEIPTSLPWNLQTLIIKKSRSMTDVAPIQIWKMRRLRHVESRRIYLPAPSVSDEHVVIENLQTLKTAVNLSLCEEVCSAIPHVKKLHLLYDRDLQGYDEALLKCLRNLSRFHRLEALKLRVNGSKFKETLTFPSSLNKLSLRVGQLHWDYLTTIGSLPQLEVLKLEIKSVKGEGQWSPIEGQFIRLKFLKIDSRDLVRWNAERCHFPVLKKLVLIKLRKMEEIPKGIGEIPTLDLIRVEKCSLFAAVSAVKIKEDRLDTQGIDDLQIHIKMKLSNVHSFKKMVKEKGLTIDNIQLEVIKKGEDRTRYVPWRFPRGEGGFWDFMIPCILLFVAFYIICLDY